MKLLIFWVLLCLPITVVSKVQDVILYVDESYPPYSFHKNGRVQGLYVDILRAAFEKMPEFNVSLRAVPWNRGRKLMEDGEGMALAPPYFHAHDWPYLYPYSIPLYQETVMVICNSAVQQRTGPNWPEDYAGLIIGSITGYDGWGGLNFKDMVAKEAISLIEVGKPDALIKLVIAGRTDCILMEDFIFDIEYRRISKEQKQHSKNQYQLYKQAIAGVDPVFVGYSAIAIKQNKFPYQAKFQRELDIALYELYKSGKIADIAHTYRGNGNHHQVTHEEHSK